MSVSKIFIKQIIIGNAILLTVTFLKDTNKNKL